MNPGTTHRAVRLLALTASWSTFLWMFLAADALERTARQGSFVPAARAERFAADWRHGLRDSALVMPGFLAVLLAAGWWQTGRDPGALLCEGVAAGATGLAVARATAPMQARCLADAFAAENALHLQGPLLDATWTAAAVGLLTVSSWTALVTGVLRLAGRGARALVLPSVLYAGLSLIRPWRVGSSATVEWARQAASGDVAALSSIAVAGCSAWLLVRHGRAVPPR